MYQYFKYFFAASLSFTQLINIEDRLRILMVLKRLKISVIFLLLSISISILIIHAKKNLQEAMLESLENTEHCLKESIPQIK